MLQIKVAAYAQQKSSSLITEIHRPHRDKGGKTLRDFDDLNGVKDVVSGKLRKVPLIGGAIIALALVLFIIFEYVSSRYYNYLWFSSEGFGNVYITNIKWILLVGALSAGVTLALFALNWIGMSRWLGKSEEAKTDRGVIAVIYFVVAVGVAFLMFVINGWGNYLDVLKYLNQVPFNVLDPIWGKDMGYYVFTLPIYQEILDLIWFVCLAISAVDFLILTGLENGSSIKLERSPLFLRVSFAAFVAAIAAKIYLDRYDVLNIATKHLAGAGLNDLVIAKSAYVITAVVLLLIALFVLSDFAKLEVPAGSAFTAMFILVVLILFVSGPITGIISGMYFGVSGMDSNEMEVQKPYINLTINNTREAYGLDQVIERSYPNNVVLNASIKDSITVQNARVFDWQPTKAFLQKNQVALERSYRIGDDIDVDRYLIEENGKKEEKQVIVATRELDYSQIPDSFPAKHIGFTHALGPIVVSVNKMGANGYPLIYSGGIPPKSAYPEFQVKEPGMWYSEGPYEYIFTNTNTPEISYQVNSSNVYGTYNSTGGIVVGEGTFRKLIMADNLDFINIMLSKDINEKSRLHIHRNIDDRVSLIVPYLYLDKDNTLFVDSMEKDQKWMISALTYTDKYPYSSKANLGGHEVNYIGDAVKIVVDSVSGKMSFYVVKKDPLIETYRKIYPGVFKDISEMPESQRNHIKYSEELFNIQSAMYSAYHVTNYKLFFYQNDQYRFSQEQTDEGGLEDAMAYSTVLENGNGTSFVLMRTFKPASEQATNLAAWMSVNQDWPHYGEMLLYTFDKSSSLNGPAQIESLISQDDRMTTDLGLWSKAGSTVIRGNMLILPVNGGIINVQPIYIAATTNAMPELKRVVVYYQNTVTGETRLKWAPTLNEALDLVFGKGQSPVSSTATENVQQQIGPGTSGAIQIRILYGDGSVKQTLVVQSGESFTAQPITVSAGGNATAASA